MITEEHYQSILDRIAKEHGVTPEAVEREMSEALKQAWANPKQGAWLAQNHRFAHGRVPTLREFLTQSAEEVLEQNRRQ